MDIRGRCCFHNNKKSFKVCPARIDTAVFHLENDCEVYRSMENSKNKRSKDAVMRKYLLKIIKLNRVDANKAIEHYWFNQEEENK